MPNTKFLTTVQFLSITNGKSLELRIEKALALQPDISVSPLAKLVFVVLMLKCFDELRGRSQVNLKLLAHDTGSSPRSVKRALKMLTMAGCITIVAAPPRCRTRSRGGSRVPLKDKTPAGDIHPDVSPVSPDFRSLNTLKSSDLTVL